MKVIVIGTVKFTLEMLETLLATSVDIVGVITGEDAGINSDFANLLPFCELHKVPCLVTSNINSKSSINWIKEKNADVIFCLGWSRLIKKELLSLTPFGVVGYHPSLLPKNRGRHPLIWALVLGLKKTGSTFFVMDEGADTGDIISQEEIDMLEDDDAHSLYQKIVNTAKSQIQAIIVEYKSNSIVRISQDDSQSNLWRKRNIEDGKIDWRMSAKTVHDLIRALTRPYVGAHLLHMDKEYKVWKSRVIEIDGIENIEPGKVLKNDNTSIVVKCGDGCIELLDVVPAIYINSGGYL